MGKNKNKNKIKDQFDLSVEEQLALLAGDAYIYNEDNEDDSDYQNTNPEQITSNMESAILEKIGNNVTVSVTEDTTKVDIEEDHVTHIETHHSEIDMEVEVENFPKFKIMQAKFDADMKVLCISNRKQLFSICLDNYPLFNNEINNDINIITMVRDAAIRKMLIGFEPTLIMNVVDFEDAIGMTLDALGENIHVFTYDDEDAAMIYELSDDFMDAIDDAIGVAIEDGKLFPMYAALMDISGGKYFRCDFDRLLAKGIGDSAPYISYLMTRNDITFVGEDINSSIDKFKAIDIEDIEDVCAKPMQIVNKIMDKIWGIDDDDDNEEIITGE